MITQNIVLIMMDGIFVNQKELARTVIAHELQLSVA